LIKFTNFGPLSSRRLFAADLAPVQPARPAVCHADRLVDADTYRDNFINFPAFWHDADFNGVLPKGTPVAQCVPVKRDIWTRGSG